MGIFDKSGSHRVLPPDAGRRRELFLFQKKIGLRFRKIGLLDHALRHRSFANEFLTRMDSNECLEFLGDSVLGLIVSDYLFTSLPGRPEGHLAKIKSFVVSEASLALIARELGVGELLLVGKGEELTGGRTRDAILSDSLEAIIGAYYIDSGIKHVRPFVLRYFVPEINKVLEDRHSKDYKTQLQELILKKYRSYPKYSLVKMSGPDHDKTFSIEVSIRGESFGPGRGKSKKQAEQMAAKIALDSIDEAEG